jgi:hypothetical protein
VHGSQRFAFAEPAYGAKQNGTAPCCAHQRQRVGNAGPQWHGYDAKHNLDLFGRTLNIFEDDLGRILAEERKKGDR